MKGHVPTPENLANDIVRNLFNKNPPKTGNRILYPGVGTAPFAAAVERVCTDEGWPLPNGLGVELNPELLEAARNRDLEHLDLEKRDFLKIDLDRLGKFDYVVGNPPYIPIEKIEAENKTKFKESFRTASGRFDLYLLFFEQALNVLSGNGWLVFITPEKFEYVRAANPLRKQLTEGNFQVKEIRHIDENSFEEDIAFPCITTVHNQERSSEADTRVFLRNGVERTVEIPEGGESWAPAIRGNDNSILDSGTTLGDVTERISPGMATGADAVFVKDRDDVPDQIKSERVYPTVSGRQLSENCGPQTQSVFICPYSSEGEILEEEELGSFLDWAELHRNELEDRTCVQKHGERWYGWHETPPMQDLLQPKIVFQDIAMEPQFFPELEGNVIPRHSVYYMIPKDKGMFDDMLRYLNSEEVKEWLDAHCQKAANGYLRLQTRVLEDLPVPRKWDSEL